MKIIIMDSERQRNYCNTYLSQMELDGSNTVIFKKTDKSSSAAQQRLWFLWCGEVSVSGIGQDDNKNDVHIRAKWQFVLPILRRDNPMFSGIYDHFMKIVEGSIIKAENCQEFARDYIHTGQLNKHQRAESLTEFQKFWVGKGVNLSDPVMQGVDLDRHKTHKNIGEQYV